jgi:hypothetical protein
MVIERALIARVEAAGLKSVHTPLAHSYQAPGCKISPFFSL